MFENAKWIAADARMQEVPAPRLRKNIRIRSEVSSAMLHVCGLGIGDYYINGQRVTEEVLITPVSKYDATVYYSSFSVTSQLHIGENTLSVLLGNGWYNIASYKAWQFDTATWRHHPKLLLQLDIRYADGSIQTVVSDSSWQSAESAITYNETRCGEVYDARLETKGWMLPDFDASAWAHVFVCRPPGGVLRPMDYTPIRIAESIEPIKRGANTYDFKKNISGWVQICVRGNRGDKVIIQYAERLGKDDVADATHINGITGRDCTTGHTDCYILKGGEEEKWAPRFVYHGFRYVTIRSDAAVLSVTGEVVYTDFDTVGHFTCDNTLINQIHAMSVLATRTNYHGLPTDCPHREQNGWTGDALMSAEQSLMNLDMHSAYRKWLRDFKDVQRPSGQLPGIVPTSAWGYNWGSGPAWDSAMILIPYYIWQYTGEIDVLFEMWENMERYMHYLYTMQEGYLLDFGLGDWPPDSIALCPTKLTDTAFYYEDAITMEKCAALLGKDTAQYHRLSANIRTAFRNCFLRDGRMTVPSQTALASALYLHMFDKNEEASALQELLAMIHAYDDHADCGILGMRYLFEVLGQNNCNDVALKIITNPTPPSYSYWLSQGQTTLCEHWDMTSSRNHHMFSTVDAWLYKYVAGFRFEGGNISVQPCPVQGIQAFTASCRGTTVHYDGKSCKITVKN